MNTFRQPDFSHSDLEFRFENDVVCIYGTETGLQRLIAQCQDLIERPGQGHIHLDRDHFPTGFLTNESTDGAIAIFDKQ